MRAIALILPLVALAACDVTPPASNAPAALQAFTWKADTDLEQRAYDIAECETSARGLPITATPSDIAAVDSVADQSQVNNFVRRCLSSRGYTLTQKPVCSTADRRRGDLVVRPEFLPPLNSIVCLDPNIGGMIVA